MCKNKPLFRGMSLVLFNFHLFQIQITAQSLGQKPEYRIFGLLIVRNHSLHHVFGVHDGAGKHMKPQQILVNLP